MHPLNELFTLQLIFSLLSLCPCLRPIKRDKLCKWTVSSVDQLKVKAILIDHPLDPVDLTRTFITGGSDLKISKTNDILRRHIVVRLAFTHKLRVIGIEPFEDICPILE